MRRSALAIVLASAAGACANLQPIDAGVCGNLIIEGSEDCDGDDARGKCRGPLDADSCRYDCSAQSCPPELVCGVGFVCRPPGICGNGVLEQATGEQCDGESPLGVCRPPGQPGECRFDCTIASCPAGFKCVETGICTNIGVCGNATVEDGEDCDPGPGTVNALCRAPGTTNECRFDCSTSPDQCPAGYGCGIDGVCRQPSGTFEVTASQVSETLGVALGDLTGDGRKDLVQVTFDGFHVKLFTSGSVLDNGPIVPAVPAVPIVGDIDGNGSDDLAFRVPSKFLSGAGELAAFLSDEGVLAPMTQYTENLPGFGVALDALPPAVNRDLVFVDQSAAHGYSFEADVAWTGPDVAFGLSAVLQTGLQPAGTLLGTAVADFRRTTLEPCDELAIAWRDTSALVVMTPCVQQTQPDLPPWNTQLTPATVVTLPGGYTPWPSTSNGPNPGGAVFGGDLNGDGTTDLIVPSKVDVPIACALVGCSMPDITSCTCHGCDDNGVCGTLEDCVCSDCAGDLACNYPGTQCNEDDVCEPGLEGCGCPDCSAHPLCPGPDSLQVAYGLGDGTFHSTLPTPPSSGNNLTSALVYDRLPNFQCSDQRGPLAAPLLAVADLNGDDLVDLVTGHGVYVSTPTGTLGYTFCPQEPWVEAIVADFDGNGTLDIFASSTTTALEYLSGVGDGTFSSQAIAAGGFPLRLVAADLDGDTLSDAAFLRKDVPGPAATGLRDIMVAFGRPFSAPAEPTIVGRARNAERLVAGRMLFGDGAAELLVQRSAGITNAAVLRGGIARQLYSPLTLRTAEPPGFATHGEVTSLEALVYGRFLSEDELPPHRFVFAAMSARFGADHRVELVSSDDGEELVEWRTPPFDCQALGPCPPWRLAAMDLDKNGIDSVVAFGDGEVVVFTETKLPQVAQRLDTGFDLFVATERGEVQAAVAGAPVVADIDADGNEDVAVLGDNADVHVFWNDGSGKLSMQRYTRIASPAPPPDVRAFRGIALLQTEDDDNLELATVSLEGIELRALESGSHTFTPGAPISRAPGGDLLVAGDVDGDGVTDLVVANALGFTLLLGEPVLP